MEHSSGKGPMYDPIGRANSARQLLSGPIGSNAPTAGQSTVAGLVCSPGSPNYLNRILSAQIRTGAVMDVAMGRTSFNYLASTFSAINHYPSGGTFAGTPFTGANAAPSVNVIRIFRSVPTTGLIIEDINFTIGPTEYFVFYGLTVNTALDGFITWLDAITF